MRLEYVYLIRHIPSGKFYAGSSYSKSCHPAKFWTEYFTSSVAVKSLITSDGVDSFEVLEVIPRPLNDARVYEATFLQSVDAARSSNWINKSNGCGQFLNYGPKSNETRAKLSKALLGKKFSEERRASHSKALIGRVHSDETKAKMSAALTGIVRSDETKKLISDISKGRKHSEEAKLLTSAALTGIVRSDDTRAKMSASAKLRPVLTCPHCSKEGVGSGMSRWHFDNCKQKGQ